VIARRVEHVSTFSRLLFVDKLCNGRAIIDSNKENVATANVNIDLLLLFVMVVMLAARGTSISEEEHTIGLSEEFHRCPVPATPHHHLNL
jgi:hypothetical protein